MVYIKHNENSRPVLVTDITIFQDMSFMFVVNLGKIIKTYKNTKMYKYFHQSWFTESLGLATVHCLRDLLYCLGVV